MKLVWEVEWDRIGPTPEGERLAADFDAVRRYFHAYMFGGLTLPEAACLVLEEERDAEQKRRVQDQDIDGGLYGNRGGTV